jgi:hypothetical protein
MKARWSHLYYYRNRIVHECDIVRKAKPRRASFHPVDVLSIMDNMDFIKDFGRLLGQELEAI